MIPAIYNWHPCRVCGLPVPAGETAHRECSERVRTDEPGELAAHLADAGDVADVYSEIRGERARQDAKWGGPEHDSQHRPVDWFRYIVEHATLALEALHTSDQPAAEYRRRMIEVAALAVAAIEAEDRAALQVSAPCMTSASGVLAV